MFWIPRMFLPPPPPKRKINKLAYIYIKSWEGKKKILSFLAEAHYVVVVIIFIYSPRILYIHTNICDRWSVKGFSRIYIHIHSLSEKKYTTKTKRPAVNLLSMLPGGPAPYTCSIYGSITLSLLLYFCASTYSQYFSKGATLCAARVYIKARVREQNKDKYLYILHFTNVRLICLFIFMRGCKVHPAHWIPMCLSAIIYLFIFVIKVYTLKIRYTYADISRVYCIEYSLANWEILILIKVCAKIAAINRTFELFAPISIYKLCEILRLCQLPLIIGRLTPALMK